MARNTPLPGNEDFLQSDLRRAIRSVLNRKQEALIGIVGGAMLLATAPVLAQEQASDELEEVVVTGLRGSLMASMNIKREAVGVVDAIDAEDIGKFPDTNLAESLQRITGVSIDRVNGEGSRVHVARLRSGLQPGHSERPPDANRRRSGGGIRW